MTLRDYIAYDILPGYYVVRRFVQENAFWHVHNNVKFCPCVRHEGVWSEGVAPLTLHRGNR